MPGVMRDEDVETVALSGHCYQVWSHVMADEGVAEHASLAHPSTVGVN